MIQLGILFYSLMGCGQGSAPKDGADAEKAAQGDEAAPTTDADGAPSTLPKPATSDKNAIIRQLSAENASLKRQLANAQRPDPYASLGIINSHEHLFSGKYLDGYLEAARRAHVAATVFVASPEFTLNGKGEKGEPSMSENTSR